MSDGKRGWRAYEHGIITSVDGAPISDLDHENNHDITIDGENRPVLPCTKSINRGIRMAIQFFDVHMRICFVCESHQFVFDPLFIGLWQTYRRKFPQRYGGFEQGLFFFASINILR